MLASVLLALALPTVLADPRHGPSRWQVVTPEGAARSSPAEGYLLMLPGAPEAPGQAWLEAAVALAARRAPVISLGPTVPPPELLPYLDGVCVEPAPPPEGVVSLLGASAGTPLVLPALDGAAAVALLAAGASTVLVGAPPAGWERELDGLLPEPVAARAGSRELPTAVRGVDLALLVGLPRGFEGGEVVLPSQDLAAGSLLTAPLAAVELRRTATELVAVLPALPGGGVVVLTRRRGAEQAFEHVGVSGERLPDVAEVLARHQRVAARQERLLRRWQAHQRLLLRVWVEQLSRSFEVVLAGPAFHEAGLGTDWELAEAWVDGVRWDPDQLPDLPLLEPKRPPVPPLSLRLEPSHRYTLEGVVVHDGRRCFELSFRDLDPGPVKRHGRALIDATALGLVELELVAEGLEEEVRATRSVTSFRLTELGGEPVWAPWRVVADDLVAAFGGTATVHRELGLSRLTVPGEGFESERSGAWARPHRMLRDAPSGLVGLVPDGRGGRVVSGASRVTQRFLLGGVVYDPGLRYPLPYGGLQVQDFDFRHRGEQLRLLLAGVINDGAWTARRGQLELSTRAFVQLYPFDTTVSEGGEEVEGEELRTTRQRLGLGVARSQGPVRVMVDLGVDRLDFRTTDRTSRDFVVPSSTWEGVARLEAGAALGAVSVSLAGEAGWRHRFEAWGPGGRERPERAWQRGRLAVVWEKAVFPLAKLHLDAELWGGRHLDRFSAAAPARFGGLRLRGIATSRVIPEAVGVVRSSLALPLSPRVRAELGLDLAWAREARSGYRARPLSGVAVAVTAPGPWKTLLQTSAGVATATPGKRSLTFELFLLRPLASRAE